ncbi:MAG: hypothetical protein WC242_02375 [Candidatus Paceibacterota bacterium]|jgi:Flp pilus assembly protein TadB
MKKGKTVAPAEAKGLHELVARDVKIAKVFIIFLAVFVATTVLGFLFCPNNLVRTILIAITGMPMVVIAYHRWRKWEFKDWLGRRIQNSTNRS